jgi:hypothetical protein
MYEDVFLFPLRFSCKCEACTGQWPTADKLPSIPLELVQGKTCSFCDKTQGNEYDANVRMFTVLLCQRCKDKLDDPRALELIDTWNDVCDLDVTSGCVSDLTLTSQKYKAYWDSAEITLVRYIQLAQNYTNEKMPISHDLFVTYAILEKCYQLRLRMKR